VIRTSRVVVLCSLLCVPSLAAVQDAQEVCVEMPANVRVEPMLQPIVSSLLRQSETFRNQCRTIARTHAVRVEIRSAMPRALGSTPRAHATITRYEFGLIRAVIEVPVGGEYAELLPHEFEHVIEIIEGIDLAERADHGDGVLEVGQGTFETTRAREAGHAASREVYGDTDEALRRTGRQIGRVWRAICARAAAGQARSAGPPSRR
jgi:hypothetical protein